MLIHTLHSSLFTLHFSFEFRDVVQPGRIHVWGACGRWFESSRPDFARCSLGESELRSNANRCSELRRIKPDFLLAVELAKASSSF